MLRDPTDGDNIHLTSWFTYKDVTSEKQTSLHKPCLKNHPLQEKNKEKFRFSKKQM